MVVVPRIAVTHTAITLQVHLLQIRNLREDVEKAASKHKAADVADFLTGMLEDHEKTAWMLRSLLE